MKTKVLLLAVVLVGAQTVFGASNQPRWEGDHPGSLLNRTRDPLVAAAAISAREGKTLTPEAREELEADKRELESYWEHVRRSASAER